MRVLALLDLGKKKAEKAAASESDKELPKQEVPDELPSLPNTSQAELEKKDKTAEVPIKDVPKDLPPLAGSAQEAAVTTKVDEAAAPKPAETPVVPAATPNQDASQVQPTPVVEEVQGLMPKEALDEDFVKQHEDLLLKLKKLEAALANPNAQHNLSQLYADISVEEEKLKALVNKSEFKGVFTDIINSVVDGKNSLELPSSDTILKTIETTGTVNAAKLSKNRYKIQLVEKLVKLRSLENERLGIVLEINNLKERLKTKERDIAVLYQDVQEISVSAKSEEHLVEYKTNKPFYLEGGIVFSTLEELAARLPKMSPQVYQKHVNHDKNDFATWVGDCFHTELGAALRRENSPQAMSKLLLRHMGKL